MPELLAFLVRLMQNEGSKRVPAERKYDCETAGMYAYVRFGNNPPFYWGDSVKSDYRLDQFYDEMWHGVGGTRHNREKTVQFEKKRRAFVTA